MKKKPSKAINSPRPVLTRDILFKTAETKRQENACNHHLSLSEYFAHTGIRIVYVTHNESCLHQRPYNPKSE